MASKEEMLDKIYEVIADKTLSFGCRVKYESKKTNTLLDAFVIDYEYCKGKGPNYIMLGRGKRKIGRVTKFMDKSSMEVIGHPVMIGDVIAYLDDIFEAKYGLPLDNCLPSMKDWLQDKYGLQKYKEILHKLLEHREDTKRSIDKENQDCIKYVYDLLPKA